MGSDGFAVSHLPYLDDTLLVKVISIYNFLTIKVVLRSFEFVLGLNEFCQE